MKKTIFFLGISIAVLTFSCKDEMSNEPFENGSATIRGTALVDTDLSNNVDGIVVNEYVPQGVRIYAEINSADLVQFPEVGVDYGTILIDTTIGTNGSFTLVVPANMKTVDVSFYADDFRADQVQYDYSVESKIFSLPTYTYSEKVYDGVIRITELIFYEK